MTDVINPTHVKNTTPKITVFGGANPRPGEPVYEEALRLGRLLAEAGYTVMTGGYIGTMEAVSRGTAEAGGIVIGVTCDEIEHWRKVSRNPWVQQEIRYPTIRTRLLALIEECDAALALPGGAGTLAEIAMMWNHLITHAIAPRPLILIGPAWQKLFEIFFEVMPGYTKEADKKWLIFAPTVEAAVEFVREKLPQTEK
jgi:uncharacterized protein (TIGR00730 family)